jgi:hypothetical protein
MSGKDAVSGGTTEEEQQRYLEDAMKEVQKQAFYMKRAMDGDSLKLALDHATEMLRELRTGLLSPKNYYELYMKILDELRELEEYLMSLQRSGRSIVEIYEQVQQCANIVPRLYLLCCVGGVYITSKEAPAKDILKDLIEMIKGLLVCFFLGFLLTCVWRAFSFLSFFLSFSAERCSTSDSWSFLEKLLNFDF